jgi:GWxTD domain-containing protein
MKKIIILSFVCVFLCACATTGVRTEKTKDVYELWFKEEVSLLLTPEERTAFRDLDSTEGKEQFIALFWKKRDPTPETELNEFKEEWYKRLAHVNKAFNVGVRKGWRSDMGKVYLFFGPPLRTQSGAPLKRDVSVLGNQQDAGDQVWVYRPKDELGLTTYFTVKFTQYQYDWELAEATPQIVRRALEIYPKTVIVNPDDRP